MDAVLDVLINATKGFTDCMNLEQDLDLMQIEHRACSAEDCRDLVHRFGIPHSPNLVVDDEPVFRKQPTEEELHPYFDTKTKPAPERQTDHRWDFRCAA